MSRRVKIVGISFAALTLVPVGAFTILCVTAQTLPQRTAHYDADLRAKVPLGGSKEQLLAWLVANKFVGNRYFTDLDRWAAEPPRSVTL